MSNTLKKYHNHRQQYKSQALLIKTSNKISRIQSLNYRNQALNSKLELMHHIQTYYHLLTINLYLLSIFDDHKSNT